MKKNFVIRTAAIFVSLITASSIVSAHSLNDVSGLEGRRYDSCYILVEQARKEACDGPQIAPCTKIVGPRVALFGVTKHGTRLITEIRDNTVIAGFMVEKIANELYEEGVCKALKSYGLQY